MTKMATIAINNKNLYFFLLQNQKAYDFEIWHAASGNRVLQICINHDTGMIRVNLLGVCKWMEDLCL